MKTKQKIRGNHLPKCMGTCWHWEQVFYQDDPEAEYEKCYQYCQVKKHEIKEKDCENCNKYKCRYTYEEIQKTWGGIEE